MEPTLAELQAAHETLVKLAGSETLVKLARRIEMGDVKDTVTKRTDKPKKPLDAGLLQTAETLRDELSRCVVIKDEDTLNEGDAARAENMRKATQLRSAHILMVGVCAQLEDYT